MTGLWSLIVLLIGTINANRVSWVEPLPGARTEPLRPIMRADEFGPESPYRILLSLADLPEAYDVVEVDGWLQKLSKHPCPRTPPVAPVQGSPWDAKTCARMRQVLRDAKRELELARRIAVMPDARVPTHLDPAAPLDEAPGLVRGLRHILILSAYQKEGEGDYAGAFAELTTFLRLASMLTRGGSTIHQMSSWPITAIAVSSIYKIASRNHVQADVLKRTAGDILEARSVPDPPSEGVRNELPYLLRQHNAYLDPRFVGRAVGASYARGYCLGRLASILLAGGTPADSRNNLTAYVGQFADLGDAPYRPEGVRRLRSFVKPLQFDTYACLDPFAFTTALHHPFGFPQSPLSRTPTWDVFVPYLVYRDPYGLAMASDHLKYFPRYLRDHAETIALLRGTALFLAVKAYENDTGRPPARLADLVPRYLAAVPKDPFDGKPFRYVVGEVPKLWGDVTWGLYSIASDFRDDGGKADTVVSAHRRYSRQGMRKNPDIIWIPKPLP